LTHNLHDSVAQAPDNLMRHADEWGAKAAQGRLNVGQSTERFNQLSEVSHQALKEMRLLTYQMHPPILKDVGLAGALQQRLATVEQQVSVETRLLVEGEVHHIAHSVEEQLFHIALEALNNALRHADATTVTVRLYAQGDLVGLSVEDNGIGFDAGRNPSGMGLAMMRERAEAIGAKLLVTSVPQLGTAVEVTLVREPVADV
jgi:signal transduction histidine kinase